jgi:hypothetical protein
MGNLIWFRLKQKQLVESGDGPLDPAGRHGLPLDKRADEQVRVGEHPSDPSQLTNGTASVLQLSY